VEAASMEPVRFERRRWSFIFYSVNNQKWRVFCECARATDADTGTLKGWPDFPVSVVETGKENNVIYTATYMNMEQKIYDDIFQLINAHDSVYLPDELQLLEDTGVN
jgi:hypothetical protein